MKKYAVFVLIVCMLPLALISQPGHPIPESLMSDTIVTIDSVPYTTRDFVWFYTKYTSYETGDSAGVDSYLDKFVEYRMKVAEAERMQLDTTKAFRDDFFKYLKITAHDRMYAGADKKREDLVKLEYDRLHWDYEVAHIFVKSNIYDSPAAKKAAEEKIKQIHDEIYHAATLPDYTFIKCVQKYSDDNLSKEYDGNVGFITAMVSPFEYENAVYNANVGDMVTVRTAEGWYLINILQKRPTKGAVDAAIIMIYPQSDDADGWNVAKQTIDSVYEQLQAGISFDTLSARYNLNDRLRETNGLLGLIDNGMPYSREIKETLFAMEHDGEYSKPLKLPYGYAIVKRRWLLPLPGFEAYRTAYEKRIEADKSRCSVVDEEYLENMKKNLSYKPNEQELENCMQYIDASILLGKWTAPKLETDATLFVLNGEKYGRNEFFRYLEMIQKNHLRDVHDKDMLVRIRFDDYVTRRVEFATMKQMEKNDKEFQYIMQEYHDGMIVYDLINQEVLQPAAEDSVGMKFYYNQHKEQYMTEPRKEHVTFFTNDEKTQAKALKLLDEQRMWYWEGVVGKHAQKIAYYEDKGTPQMFIVNEINAKRPNSISVDVGDKILKTADDVVDTVNVDCKTMCEKIAIFENKLKVHYYYIASRQQTIKEAKEQLMIDYQRQVEEQWLRAVKKRHNAVVNQSVVDEIKRYL